MMPAPDFEQLAEQLRFRLWGHDRSDPDTDARVRHAMVDALRQAWNARGEVDIKTLVHKYHWLNADDEIVGTIKGLDR